MRAKINYSADNGRPIDYYFYDPDPALELNPPGTDVQEVEIRDGWAQAASFHADREGFCIADFPNSFNAFDDEAAIKSAFYD